MDAELEAAVVEVLERAAARLPTDDAWLRAAHPARWREIRAFLAFEARVAGGAPGGSRVGPYRLLRRLGRGGAGTVYLAHREGGGDAPVAVKVLHPHLAADDAFVARALAEARAAAGVAHPNVVRTLDAGCAEDGGARAVYVVTEYVEGQNLRGLLDELGPLGERLVRHVAAEILRGLAALHAAGAAHGDLKPENVLVTPHDAVLVADVAASAPAPPRAFHGTVLYAAPEQLAGAAPDARSDLYSLGLLVEEMLAGAHPLLGTPRDRRARGASAALRAFAATLRDDDPARRFASADAALAALRTLPDDPPEGAAPEPWAAGGARATSLHGREREMDRLRTLLEDAAHGRPRCAVVVADAGGGKSRVVEELAAHARAAGAAVVWRRFGDAGTPPAPVAHEARAALDAGRTVLVVAEDVHAADDAELAAVGRLADADDGTRLLAVATTRRARLGDVRAALDGAVVVDLPPLAADAVGALVAEVLASDELGDALAPEVHRRTDGNALAVLETLDALRDAGTLVRDERGTWSLRGELRASEAPASARAILAGRLAALPRADRDVLETAACTGARFRPALVARALGRDPGRVLLRLVRLERRDHLVRTVGDDAAFEHHEVRDAVLQALAPERARELHAAIGRAIVATSPPGAPSPSTALAVARHALAAGDSDLAAPHVFSAVETLRADARMAEAIDLATRALDLPGAVQGAARAQLRLVRAASQSFPGADMSAECALAAQEAETCGDRALARRARRLQAEGLFIAGRPEGHALAHGVLEEALAEGATPEEVEEARHTLGLSLRYRARFAEAVEQGRALLASRRARGATPLELSEAESSLAQALEDAREIDEALRFAQSAVANLRDGAGSQLLLWTQSCEARLLARTGRRTDAAAALERAAHSARSIGDAGLEAVMRGGVVEQLRTLARRDEADAHVRRLLVVAPRVLQPLTRHYAVRAHALHLFAAGRLADALAEAARAAEIAERGNAVASHVVMLGLLAEVHARAEDPVAAARAAAESLRVAERLGVDVVVAHAQFIAARWADPSGAADVGRLTRELDRQRGRCAHDNVAMLLAHVARAAFDARADDAAARLVEARAACAAQEFANLVVDCDARLAALGAADPAAVAARLSARWDGHDLFTRVLAAGLVAGPARDAELAARARADVEFAAAHAPPERAADVRRRLGAALGAAG